MTTLTPGMIQYYELKKEYQDSILFFRMGDFYEMFDEDAKIAHKILGINITSRNKNAAKPIPLAGIPYHAKEKYLPILVEAGHKVAIAEQVSDPKLKGIVKREVVRVVTPATLNLEGENYSDGRDTNYIASITQGKNGFGFSILESSSTQWRSGEFENKAKLFSELFKYSPQEVILEKNLFTDTELTGTLQKKYSLNIYYFSPTQKAYDLLINHFKTQNLVAYGIENKVLAISASALLLEYMKTNQKSDLEHLQSLSYDGFSDFMEIDEATIRNLDLIYNIGTRSSHKGTLLGVLDETKTPMGKRFLKNAIVRPLQEENEINRRLEIAEEFKNNIQLLELLRNKLCCIADLENIVTRLSLNRANPRDLLQLKRSLQAAQEVQNIIQERGSEKLNLLLRVD